MYHKSFFKQVAIWIKMNTSLFVILLIAFVILTLAFMGIRSLDSYPRTQLLANTPITLLKQIVSTFLFVFIVIKFLRGDTSNITNNDTIVAEKVNVRFNEIVGADEAKEEAREVVELLKGDQRLQSLGARALKGVLMIGPPGCGKTMLAKAIATEANIPFLPTSGSEMTDMYVGVGAGKIRQVFKKARLLAKEYGACIIFIDEIDVIGKKRQFGESSDQESNKTLNQLLVEMDGIMVQSAPITVIAATNAPEDTLDTALMRAGRFDRKLHYNLPTRDEREALFEYFLNKQQWNEAEISIPFWSGITVYRSPAEIQNIVEESKIIAIRNKHAKIEATDMSEALERIDLGLRRAIKVLPEEREATAYHEAGHLVAIHYLSPEQTFFKISIAFRRESLGRVHFLDKEESSFRDRAEFMGYLQGIMGGFAAEKLKYSITASGVRDDFEKASRLAFAMVYQHGMGRRGHLGNFTRIPPHQLSEALKWDLNQDMEDILQEALHKTQLLLKEKWELVETLVKELIEKEELEMIQIHRLLDRFERAKGGPINLRFH